MRAAKTQRDAFREAGRCMLCEFIVTPLDVHEIASGPHRRSAYQDVAAWLRLCRRCHDTVQAWPIVKQLALKAIRDHGNYDRVRVNELRGRAPDAISEREVMEAIARMFNGSIHEA